MKRAVQSSASLISYGELALHLLYESPLNNRRTWPEGPLAELAESIRSKGVLTPLLVRRNPRTSGGDYEILAGSRRFRAAQRAALSTVPCRVLDVDDVGALEVVIIDNLQREDVSPLEEAEGYQALLERSSLDVPGLAAKVHKSVSYVYQRLKLIELVERARLMLAGGVITAGHAILIARLKPKDQEYALDELIWSDIWAEERVALSVRELGIVIRDHLHVALDTAPFDKVECLGCSKRRCYEPALFPVIPAGDECLDSDCYQAKERAYYATAAANLGAQSGPPLPQGRVEGTASMEPNLAEESEPGDVGGPLLLMDWDASNHAGLTRNRWGAYCDLYSAGYQTCTYTREGVIAAAGALTGEAGRRVRYCLAEECMVHRGEARRQEAAAKAETAAAKKARQLEDEVAAEVYLQCSQRAPVLDLGDNRALGSLADVVVDLIRLALEEMTQDGKRALCRGLGLVVGKSKADRFGAQRFLYGETVSAHVEALASSPARLHDLYRLALLLPLYRAAHATPDYIAENIPRDRAELYKRAKGWGIDADRIRRKLQEAGGRKSRRVVEVAEPEPEPESLDLPMELVPPAPEPTPETEQSAAAERRRAKRAARVAAQVKAAADEVSA